MNNSVVLGIDLGTTNSVVAWGMRDPNNGKLHTQVLTLPRMVKGGGQENRPLLPSVVYFKDGSAPIVGDLARFMWGTRPQNVVKSVKSFMGSDQLFSIAGEEYSPHQVSAYILSHIRKSAASLLGFEPDRAVITVPASFDSDMRQDTLKAAKEAGFQLAIEGGEEGNILLDEPRAVLYDFINRQQNGEIPGTVVSFQQPKTVMVFDLGGGTLDVSLHRVWEENGKTTFQDLAISRYTQIGGDLFDERVRDNFLGEFRSKLRGIQIDTLQERFLQSNFQVLAERAKIELSDLLSNPLLQGEAGLAERNVDILQGYILDSRGFEKSLNLEQYRKMVHTLLGPELTLQDLERFEQLEEHESQNILYPILDVLKKARDKERTNGQNPPIPTVDLVLLNGGMTRFPLVSKRLEEFLGQKPVCVMDPDQSVARGAAIYHLKLQSHEKATAILHETIGLETTGGYVVHLIPAGTVLPCQSPIQDDFEIPVDGATSLSLPVYLGWRNDTRAPNRKIMERVVRFPKPLQKGQRVSVQLSVDTNNIIHVKGWLSDKPGHSFQESGALSGEASAAKTSVTPFPKKKTTSKAPFGPELPLVETAREYRKLARETSNQTLPQLRAHSMKRLLEMEKKIYTARNNRKFINSFLQVLPSENDFCRTRMLQVLGNMCEYLDDSDRSTIVRGIQRFLLKGFLQTAGSKQINTVVRTVVETIGKAELPLAEEWLINLLENQKLVPIHSQALISLGKTGTNVNSLRPVERFLQSPKKGERIAAYWALGKLGSREKESPLPISHLEPVLDRSWKRIPNEQHPNVAHNFAYALAEIGAPALEDALSPKKKHHYVQLLGSFQQMWKTDILVQRIIGIAKSLLRGEALTSEQRGVLLSIRSQLKVSNLDG
ncbi:MAG TPA: Hsp70 family protein [Thermotogota bacterium]|nr:Hsp70 family protein [Thermotogota bacterium]